MGRVFGAGQVNSRARQVLVGLFVFGLAFVPRLVNLKAYVAADEAKWILRSAHFLAALLRDDLGAAASQVATPDVEVLAPAVTTLWSGAFGLWCKHLFQGAGVPLLDYLAALPYDFSEQVPLDFYPWLRFPTVLITSFFVVAFYFLVRKLFPKGRIALLAAILLALDPFFLNHSRVIHHDALVTVFTTLSLLCLLVFFQREAGWPWLVCSGICLGLAVLTKPTALVLLPFFGLVVLWRVYHTSNWGKLKWAGVWLAVGLAAFFVAWPALWGDPAGTLARLVQTSMTAGVGDDHLVLLPAIVPNRILELGFLYYPVNWVLRWGILPTIGLVVLVVTRRRGAGREETSERTSLIWLVVFCLILLLALIPLGTRDVRYYLPAWPALIVLAAAGLEKLPRWVCPMAVAAACLVFLIPYYPYYVTYYNPLVAGPVIAPRVTKIGGGEGMDRVAAYLNAQPGIQEITVVSSMLESFVPYYSGHVVEHRNDAYAGVVVNYVRQIQNGNPSDEYLAYFAARTPDLRVRLAGIDYVYVYTQPSPRPVRDVVFGDVRLLAQTLDNRWAEPGRETRLTLIWQAPEEASSIPVWLEVRDLSGQVWSADRGPLVSPGAPSSVEGHYSLALPSGMPRGDYQLWAAEGEAGDWTQIGIVPVRRFAPPATIPYPVEARFGDYLALEGFDLSQAEPSPGQTLTLTLYWRCLQAMPRSYTTFVHLLDGDGNRIAQSDVVPGSGDWPTDTWLAGEWIADRVELSIPAQLAAGEYHLVLGWYDWQTGERLALADRDGATEFVLTGLQLR